MSRSIVATGDFLPQRPPGEPVAALLRAGDIAFVNLEGPLTDLDAPEDTVAWVRGERALAGALGAAGVQVATLANNHAADFGIAGLLDTASALAEAGIETVGAGPDLARALRARVVVGDGPSIAFLGFASTLPNGCAAGPRRAGIAPVRVVSRFVVDPVVLDQNPGMAPYVETIAREEDVAGACAAVAAAAELADVVVVGVHWGVPVGWAPSFQSELADYQRPLAHALIDAGADAIVGHHPHVLHGIEVYSGRPIFYSLGNFLFHILVSGELALARPYPAYDFTSIRGRLGGVARLRWSRPGPPERAELAIVALDESGEPRLAAREEAVPAIEQVNALSARFGVRIAGDGDWLAVQAS